MENAQILKLVEAGFTAEEIRKMETETGADQGKTDPKPKAPETETKVQSGEITDNSEVLTQLTNTVAELSKTVKELQAGNINNAKGSAPSAGDKIKDVMDSFIKEL